MKKLTKMIFASFCLAMCMVLPFLTGQIGELGKALSPMHIPVFICGMICGWKYGMGVGLIAPLMRSLIFGMPPLFPVASAMSLELLTYGLVSGLIYELSSKKTTGIYISLILAMLAGRFVWGFAMTLFMIFGAEKFTFAAFLSGAFIKAVPGIVLHILIIPPIVYSLSKMRRFQADENESAC